MGIGLKINSCAVLSPSVVSALCNPMDCSLARLLCPWGFSRQEYWSGLPCLPPGDLLNPGIKARSPALQADSSPSETPGKPPNIIQRETNKYHSPLGGRRKKIPLPHEKVQSQNLNFSKFLIPTTNFRRYRGQRSILYNTVEIPTAETQIVGNATGQMT